MKKNGEHFVTCGQMKLLERRADENGLSYYQMMEAAGSKAAAVIMDRAAYSKAVKEDLQKRERESKNIAEENIAARKEAAWLVRNKDGFVKISSGSRKPKAPDKHELTKVYVFCGKGNNGGDGFVAAREMYDKGYDVTVILVDGAPVTEDAATNYELLKQRNIQIADMVKNNRTLIELKAAPDIIVDAIYGTGFKGKLSGNGLKAAIYINRYAGKEYRVDNGKTVIVAALDIPSGLGGDLINKKELDDNTVKADFTITFHAKKPVHVQSFAAEYCGEIFVADIGIDEEKLLNVDIEQE